MLGIDTFYILSFVIYYSVKWSFNVFLFYCVCNTIAPAQTKQAVMDSSWWLLELFTVIQMSINSKKARFVKYISHWLPDEYVKQRKYGNVSSTTTRSSLRSASSASSSNNNDNSINFIYIDKDGFEILSHDESKRVALTIAILPDDNVIVRSNRKTLADIATDIENLELAEKFLMTSIKIDKTPKRKDINMSLSSPLNFYIIGNHILNLPFIQWYLREILKMNIIIDKDTTVNVIDGSANMLNYKLTNGRGIVLQKVGVDVIVADNGIPDIDDVSSDGESFEPVNETNKTSNLNCEPFTDCTCDTGVDCKLGEVYRDIQRDTKHTNNEKNKEE